MRAFVLSGGGAHGDFQLGALRYLYRHDISPELIVSTSIGSIHGVKLAEGFTPTRNPLSQLEDIWLSLRGTEDFYVERPWFARVQEQLEAAESTLVLDEVTSSTLGAVTTVLNPIALATLIFDAFETLEDISAALSTLRSGLRETSIYDISPIATLLQREVNPTLVATSGIRLRMCVVEYESGRVRYMTERGTLDDDDPGPVVGELWQGALASASIPVLFPVVRLNGLSYFDGGVRDVLPIKRAVQMGADDIWAISTSSSTPSLAPAPSGDTALLDVLNRAVGLLNTEILARSEDPFNGWPADVKLIAPTFSVHSSREIVPALIRVSRDYGWMRAEDLFRTLYPHTSTSRSRVLPMRPIGLGRALGPSPVFGAIPAPDRNRNHPVRPRVDYAETSDEITQARADLYKLDKKIVAVRESLRVLDATPLPPPPPERIYDTPDDRRRPPSRSDYARDPARIERTRQKAALEAEIATLELGVAPLTERIRVAVARRLALGLQLPPWVRGEGSLRERVT